MLSPRDFAYTLTLTLPALGLLGEPKFMIDTGAAPNLIKVSTLNPKQSTLSASTIYLCGITEDKVETLGMTSIKYLGHTINFHVVDDDFPVPQDGILGSDFLQDASILDFVNRNIIWKGITLPLGKPETLTIPARSRTTLQIHVANSVTTGYIPRIQLDDDIYLGDAVVTNRNGRAYVGIINATKEDYKMVIPTVELQEIESYATTCPPQIANKFNKNLQHPENDEGKTQHIMSITQQDSGGNHRAETIKGLLRLNHLNREEAAHVNKLINNNSDLFWLSTDKLHSTNVLTHKIPTINDQPINTKQYRFPPIHKEEINRQIKTLLESEVIEPSTSPYNSPLWIVPKKPDSKGNKRWRMVIDYRALNEKTIGDAYPLPNITDILDQLGSAKYFSVFDLASGFHQIKMNKDHAHKTAFSTPHGHYEFTRMPFGLKNAPATFQRLMDQVLSGLQGTELFVYLDDIVLYSSSLREHEIKFKTLADRLRHAGLRLQPDKCEFLRKEVVYLGHVISETGVKPDPQKIEAVQQFPTPKTAKNIKQFLGLAGYYRRFIPDFSKISKPLTSLLKKEVTFNWTESQNSAFNQLRSMLCKEPILQYPDFTKTFIVTTDASGFAVGGVLSQGPIGKDLPISYTSRLLNNAEQNYSTIEKELLAIVYCVNHFRPYLYGRKFVLITDHKPLVWLHSVKDPTSRLVRWRLKLQEYEYEVIYKAGKINTNADALSRNPVPLLPLSITTNPSSSDEEIFSSKPRNKALNPNVEYPSAGRANSDDSEREENLPTDQQSDKNQTDSSTDDSNHDSDSEIFDNSNPPYVFSNPKMTFIRDNFSTRRDNLVIFVTQKGEPCDEGARILLKQNENLNLSGGTLGRAKIHTQGNCRVIALTVKEKEGYSTELKIVKEALHSLLDVITELQLKIISICRSNIAEIAWLEVFSYMRKLFTIENLTILICTNQIEIPDENKREEIIKENHASAIGGHKGITKTYYRIKHRYFWPHMKREIEAYIQNCRNCQLKKLTRIKTKQPMILTDTPDASFDKVSIDIMGPLPTSPNGYNYILTIQDLLTKYSLAIPLRSASALEVADAFVQEFICIYGAPKALLTDQGSHFLNSLMRAIARKFRITHFKATAYRPQTSGSIERSHHVLWEYLKQFTIKNDWDTHLKLASFSYNTSLHEGTKFTPYELVFGRIARVPSGDDAPGDEQNESYTSYLTDLFNKIRNAQENAKRNLIAYKEKTKTRYDKKINPHNFKVGDYIFLLKEPLKGKLSAQYTGPYEIIQILPRCNVKLKISNSKTKIVHMNKIKIART